MNQQPTSRRELDLLALRYVAGELTVEECDRFESQLAVDLAAAEAVARAVEMVERVAAAEASREATCALERRTAWLNRAGWLVSLAASVVGAVVGWYQLTSPHGPAVAPEDPVHNVALVWAETHEVVAADLTTSGLAEDGESGLDESDVTSLDSLDAADLLDDEAWIVEAVEAMSSSTSHETHVPGGQEL